VSQKNSIIITVTLHAFLPAGGCHWFQGCVLHPHLLLLLLLALQGLHRAPGQHCGWDGHSKLRPLHTQPKGQGIEASVKWLFLFPNTCDVTVT